MLTRRCHSTWRNALLPKEKNPYLAFEPHQLKFTRFISMKNNLRLFEACLKNRESVLDDYYCHDEAMIISAAGSRKSTAVMKVAAEVRERLTAIRVAIRDAPDANIIRHLQEIAKSLANPNANYIEFTSFFPVVDFTFSMYRELGKNEKIEFLDAAARRFIKQRHSAYEFHGYTATTIQVRKDFERHKTRGFHGSSKIESLLTANGYNRVVEISKLKKGTYIFPSSGVAYQETIHKLRNSHGLIFTWAIDHQDKMPDLIMLNHAGELCIGEFKHIKEGGGGQDKQLAELISLIQQSEDTVCYLAFLDGLYFNRLADVGVRRNERPSKMHRQIDAIRHALKANPRNFFVNTHGINTLLKIKKSWTQ
jgi:hypothetical protein